MKIFTTQERNVIAALSILLLTGLGVKEWKSTVIQEQTP